VAIGERGPLLLELIDAVHARIPFAPLWYRDSRHLHDLVNAREVSLALCRARGPKTTARAAGGRTGSCLPGVSAKHLDVFPAVRGALAGVRAEDRQVLKRAGASAHVPHEVRSVGRCSGGPARRNSLIHGQWRVTRAVASRCGPEKVRGPPSEDCRLVNFGRP